MVFFGTCCCPGPCPAVYNFKNSDQNRYLLIDYNGSSASSFVYEFGALVFELTPLTGSTRVWSTGGAFGAGLVFDTGHRTSYTKVYRGTYNIYTIQVETTGTYDLKTYCIPGKYMGSSESGSITNTSEDPAQYPMKSYYTLAPIPGLVILETDPHWGHQKTVEVSPGGVSSGIVVPFPGPNNYENWDSAELVICCKSTPILQPGETYTWTQPPIVGLEPGDL